MSVLTLAQAKAHLNITVATYDSELQEFINVSEAALTRVVGPLASTATTVKVSHPGGAMILPTTPAISLTSITDSGGSSLGVTGLTVSPEGIVFGGSFASDLYTVVYNAGRASTPDDLLMAVKELVRHMWTTQRGGGPGRPGSPQSDMLANTIPGAAYMFPIRVEQLIAPHVQVP